ncbi:MULTISPECIES: hypothetical protein [unclassified Streptomyces]|uniref:hypothetical protein n=1 Tax=unclassified Streptomyces TaxID=2593676 RepID=UPI0005AA89D0|nr:MULTISPECIES: hypothetical protein [unclassified Streptomyces]ODA74743.1 hypothetical protein APS67_000932 [Streptomyces sp. AVP053U2]
MKRLLEILGFIALLQGAASLVNEFTGWNPGVVRRLDFLEGFELYAGITLLVLGIALLSAAESGKSG